MKSLISNEKEYIEKFVDSSLFLDLDYKTKSLLLNDKEYIIEKFVDTLFPDLLTYEKLLIKLLSISKEDDYLKYFCCYPRGVNSGMLSKYIYVDEMTFGCQQYFLYKREFLDNLFKSFIDSYSYKYSFVLKNVEIPKIVLHTNNKLDFLSEKPDNPRYLRQNCKINYNNSTNTFKSGIRKINRKGD